MKRGIILYVCKNCGKAYPTQINFCPSCGGNVVETYSAPASSCSEPSPASSVYGTAPTTPPTPPAGYTYASPEPSVPAGARVKGIISMVMGIWGVFTTFISFILFAVLAEIADSYYRSYSEMEEMAGFIIGWTIVNLGVSIAGLILGNSSRNEGFNSGISKTGKILSLISIIIHGILIIATFGLIS